MLCDWQQRNVGHYKELRTMKKTIFAGISAIALLSAFAVAPVFAADIYRGDAAPASFKDGRSPLLSWTGFYLGGHVGGAWSTTDLLDSTPSTVYANSHFSSEGVIGGGQFGYNLQSGSLVYGLEVDLGDADISGSKTIGSWHYNTSGGLYGDITGRLGFAQGPALIYAKGGAAFLNATYKTGGTTLNSKDETTWGWTAGAGVEYMVRPNWSIKAEYQHFEFDDTTVLWPNSTTNTVKFSPTADAVTLGVNYHLGHTGYEPLK
jgi:outer membrane immunogenic protein